VAVVLNDMAYGACVLLFDDFRVWSLAEHMMRRSERGELVDEDVESPATFNPMWPTRYRQHHERLEPRLSRVGVGYRTGQKV
jgi:hypothetical protein